MATRLALALCCALLGCQRASHPSAAPPADQTIAQRFAKFQQPSGWPVSLRAGQPVNQGDSLFFAGLALYALGCTDGEPVAAALHDMLQAQAGAVYRHPSLKGQAASLDGLLTMYRGIGKRVTKCGEAARWTPVMAMHRDSAAARALVPAPFDFVRDSLLYQLGLVGKPSGDREAVLALAMADWVEAVKSSRTAGYRVHLALVSLQTVGELGRPVSAFDRLDVCAASAGIGIATFEQWCGRPGLPAALQDFHLNEWQYHWQRAAWEAPDGAGDEQPGIDYLVGTADMGVTP